MLGNETSVDECRQRNVFRDGHHRPAWVFGLREPGPVSRKYGCSLSYRGVAYMHKGDHDQAIVDTTQAIRLNPDYAKAYHNRGKVYELKGSKDKAAADFAKAKQLGDD